MKFGMRKPNLKKSIKARTTGKVKRAVKRSLNPLYDQKGTGLIKDPKKSIYNKVYNKTTMSINDTHNKSSRKRVKSSKDYSYSYDEFIKKSQPISVTKIGLGIYTCGISLLFTGIRKKPKK